MKPIFLTIDNENEGILVVSEGILSKRICPTCKVQFEYKGVVDAYIGRRGFEIVELIGSIFVGFLILAIRHLMVRRTTFNSYVCPLCHYTTLIMKDADTITDTDRSIKYNEYREYKKKLEIISQLFSEIKRLGISSTGLCVSQRRLFKEVHDEHERKTFNCWD